MNDNMDMLDIVIRKKELYDLRTDIVTGKQCLVVELQRLKGLINGKGKLANQKYNSITAAKLKTTKRIKELDGDLTEIKHELRNLALAEDVEKLANGAPFAQSRAEGKVVAQLEGLRQKYMAFASDQTRISSMRIMAAEVAQDIEQIIRA